MGHQAGSGSSRDRSTIDGLWRVRYSARQKAPFGNVEGDSEEAATILLADGKISGRDPWGYEYSGHYAFHENQLKAFIAASPYRPDAQPIFEGISGPFHLEVTGEYNSPNYFSARGPIVEEPSEEIVLNCSRVRAPG